MSSLSALLQRIAPHRYRYDRDDCEYERRKSHHYCDYPTWRKGLPYQRGDVVFARHLNKPRKALIVGVGCEYDSFGDRMERYKCRLLTEKGEWSKRFYNKYPGDIQAGYLLAGLAPEMPKETIK